MYFIAIETFTKAAMVAKGQEIPAEPKAMDMKARRFVWDMVMSELGELVLAENKADQVDALADAMIYCIDSAIRHGWSDLWRSEQEDESFLQTRCHPPMNRDEKAFAHGKVYNILTEFLLSTDLDSQRTALFDLILHLGLKINLAGYETRPIISYIADANDSKLVDGCAILSEAGKVLKPEGFVAPDIALLLRDMDVEYGRR